MKIVVLSPTEIEARAIGADVICGVGAVETAISTIKVIDEFKPDLIILAGITGSYSADLNVGDVVLVESEYSADMGSFRDGGFSEYQPREYRCPYVGDYSCRSVKSNTVNICCAPFIKHPADIENMEGAGFFAACLSRGIKFLEIRAVSNRVEVGAEWNIQLALNNLALALKEFAK